MFTSVQPQIAEEIGRIRADGLYKTERVISSPAARQHRRIGRRAGTEPVR